MVGARPVWSPSHAVAIEGRPRSVPPATITHPHAGAACNSWLQNVRKVATMSCSLLKAAQSACPELGGGSDSTGNVDRCLGIQGNRNPSCGQGVLTRSRRGPPWRSARPFGVRIPRYEPVR